MMKNKQIQSLKTLPNYTMDLLFIGGEKRVYDFKPLMKRFDCFKSFLFLNTLLSEIIFYAEFIHAIFFDRKDTYILAKRCSTTDFTSDS